MAVIECLSNPYLATVDLSRIRPWLDSATFDQPERASVRFSKSIVPEPGVSALRLMSLQNTRKYAKVALSN
jgi:hypothetical protein